MSNKKLFLIDGNSFCYRAFYAIRSLVNSKGQPTNAVYGFITMLQKLVKENQPDMLAVAFDLKGPTFRHEKFDDYKAHRKPMPDDLVTQIPYIKKVVEAYNIPIFELQGYEADDVLATLAKRAETKGMDTFIVTGDKDALQLVNDNIKVFNTHKEVVFDASKVKEAFGVGPERMTDIMALMGDATDNIPGITGIGEKTAIELISEFGSLDSLYENLDKIKSESRKKLLSENERSARLSKELAVLDTNVPIDIDFNDLRLKDPDDSKLLELFRELEFKTLVRDVTPKGTLKSEYELISDEKRLAWLVKELESLKEFAFDFETTHEDPMQAKLAGVSFSWEVGKAYFLGLRVPDTADLLLDDPRKFDVGHVLKMLKPVFENAGIKKIGQNIKYEYIVLWNYDIRLKGITFDTMVASYLQNPSKLNHNLEDISLDHLGHKMTTPITDLIGKGKAAITMDKVDIEKVSAYCCEDSDVTLRAKNVLEKELKEKGLDKLFHEVEMPLVEVLAIMEINGVTIDKDYLSRLSVEMDKKLAGLTKEIFDIAGEEFNINSPKQLSKILFEKLKLPIIKRTKTGISTDEDVLTKLAKSHPLPDTLLKFREFSKLKSTYVDSLPAIANPRTGRVHTSFNQTVTATGRLSSSEPNLQNIPIKTEEGRKIRKAFIASSRGNLLVSADYSQIELRVLAHLSGDKELISAFKQGSDIHSYTASLVFGIAEKEVTKDMRNMAKTVNFGIVYGMSPFGLSQSLGIDVSKAKDFIDAYFTRYPGVKTYLESLVEEARKNGFVTTILGRRRYIPEIGSQDMRMRQFSERTAINTPIQGSAADLIKIAMIEIQSRLEKLDTGAKMIMQVHDELVFDCPGAELDSVVKMVRDGMENVRKLDVPLVAEVEFGHNWLEMEPA
jgi:DNA polymerase-1